jgi:hypothetical protein
MMLLLRLTTGESAPEGCKFGSSPLCSPNALEEVVNLSLERREFLITGNSVTHLGLPTYLYYVGAGTEGLSLPCL